MKTLLIVVSIYAGIQFIPKFTETINTLQEHKILIENYQYVASK